MTIEEYLLAVMKINPICNVSVKGDRVETIMIDGRKYDISDAADAMLGELSDLDLTIDLSRTFRRVNFRQNRIYFATR